MSLFTGNIVNEGGVGLDCEFKFLHYDTGALSNVRSTELTQWQIDSDDADVNNQAAAFASGDIAIIHYYTGDACGIVKVVGDGSDSYVFDVQLLGCQAPTIVVTVPDIDKNGAVTVGVIASDQYQWDYNGITHYHKADWYGKVLCDSVGIATIEYDFGDGYQNENTYTVNIVGEYTVSVRVTNNCGEVVEQVVAYKVRYTEPVTQLSNTPIAPGVGEQTIAEVVNTDTDSRIVNQVWYHDEVETTELTWSYQEIGSHEFKVVTTWNDGFEDKVYEDTLAINMQAAALIVDLAEIHTEEDYTFTANIQPGDGTISTINWKVWYTLPISGQEAQVFDSNGADTLLAGFTSSGTYRILVTITDEYGVVGIDEMTVVVADTSGSGTCDNMKDRFRFDWE